RRDQSRPNEKSGTRMPWEYWESWSQARTSWPSVGQNDQSAASAISRAAPAERSRPTQKRGPRLIRGVAANGGAEARRSPVLAAAPSHVGGGQRAGRGRPRPGVAHVGRLRLADCKVSAESVKADREAACG